MTLPKTTIQNRKNAQKSTGPTTGIGKAKVRGNAITHGARAKNFINENEQEAYQLFFDALQQQYPSSNPLVHMQLDRIAKFKVQADRIQRSIDATFAASELEQPSNEMLMDLLGMDENEKTTANDFCAGNVDLKEFVNLDRIRVAAELAAFDIAAFRSPDDFLFHTPLFCQFLFNEVNEYGEEINNFIEKHADLLIPLTGDLKEIFKRIIRLGNPHNHESSDDSNLPKLEPTVENMILSTKLKNLHNAARLFANEISRVGDVHYKVLAFNQLKKIERKPFALNYEQLDKLQRYQTTVQGQLSRMVGELLELVK